MRFDFLRPSLWEGRLDYPRALAGFLGSPVFNNVGGGAGAGGAGSGDGGGFGEGAPPDPKQQKLSDENASLRVKIRDQYEPWTKLAKEHGFESPEKLREHLEKSKNTGSPSGDDDDKSASAKLKRDYDALKVELDGVKKGLTEKEQKAQQKTLTAELTKLAAAAGLNAAETAVAVLSGKAKVAEDGEVVFVVPDGSGGTREVPVNAESLKAHAKVLLGDAAPLFLPADGKSGTGSTRPAGGAGGLDLAKILQDPKEYAKHRDAILQGHYGALPS